MPHIVDISDDLDLGKIKRSGQCFRVSSADDGLYRFIARDKVLYIRHMDGSRFEISCGTDEWDDFWSRYFDLDTDYAAARRRCRGRNRFVDEAMEFGRGIRILQQDPWEMLITFIISQRKNMPAIATCVETVSRRFGSPIVNATDPCELEWDGSPFEGIGATAYNAAPRIETTRADSSSVEASDDDVRHGVYPLFAFPSPEQLASASEADLRDCSLGYRASYIQETASMVEAGALDLIECAELEDDELVVELKRARGVGDKVANCIALFGYGRLGNVPVDVWIARAIDEECDGCDPFAQYGDDAGLMQQYVFYYMTQRNR